ncbi:MAG TPA: methylated-DNA--[protein]-cysteine S-methyltransferase [Anaerolineaceae bacterium]|nr:methylated-DNA--[protein]-cysteine S-methyltransferase [Anaerolineaceae bacterium]
MNPYFLTTMNTPLGELLLGATNQGVCLVEFSGQAERVQLEQVMLEKRDLVLTTGSSQYLEDVQAELKAYFAGKLRGFNVPLDAGGSEFQRRVWAALVHIPYGETRSYNDLALQLGQPGGSRAVGTANGSNPIAIVVPCHRVITTSGKLGGYGGGLWRKEWLLNFEGRQAGTRLGI